MHIKKFLKLKNNQKTSEKFGRVDISHALAYFCANEEPEGGKEHGMEKLLAIICEDAAYGRTLGDYMSASHVITYRVNVFYSLSDFLIFADNAHADVILVDEGLSGMLPFSGEEARFVLSEKRCERGDGIFKYQALDVFVKELYFKLHDRISESFGEEHRFRTFSVCAGKGGSGVSTFALLLCAAAKKMGSTLLVSFDPFPQLPSDMEKSEGDLGELIYSLRLSKTRWTEHAEEFIRHGSDFDFICGVLSFEDINNAGKEEARDFFAGLSSFGRYDNIVFDLGIFPAAATVVMEKSEKIFIIGSEEDPASEMLKKQICAVLGEEYAERTVTVSLPFDSKFAEGKPEYISFEDTEMYALAKKLLLPKEKSLTVEEKKAPKAAKEELMVKEKETEYSTVRGKLRRLVEKGFSEGFRG